MVDVFNARTNACLLYQRCPRPGLFSFGPSTLELNRWPPFATLLSCRGRASLTVRAVREPYRGFDPFNTEFRRPPP